MMQADPTGDPAVRRALDGLLLSMADDEFVIGFSDSEWTGIAPMLEEDVAMSSIAQDELGHARALYELLATLRDDGHDADTIAYDRQPDEYRHCRLLDHGRGDWAMTVARRFLYDTADAVRLEALAESSYGPLADLVAKIRREERYHVMHAGAWLDRLSEHPGEPRRRLEDALAVLAADASTVFTELAGESELVSEGIVAESMQDLAAQWRRTIAPTLERLRLAVSLEPAQADGREHHSDSFRWLWGEFTSVRRLDPVATW
jgi:ring-1,2-phenylacetyl-CoA epoxidase subunit PaaC